MTDTYQAFTSHQETISDFLTEAQQKDHGDVVYLKFPPNAGVFEDQCNRSLLFVEYTDDGASASEIAFSLQGEGGLIHEWVRMFREEWGATVTG